MLTLDNYSYKYLNLFIILTPFAIILGTGVANFFLILSILTFLLIDSKNYMYFYKLDNFSKLLALFCIYILVTSLFAENDFHSTKKAFFYLKFFFFFITIKVCTEKKNNFTLIALDGITNPQNLGMIIRSVTASPSYGILLPNKGNAALSPLVVKASAGTIFKSTLIKCNSLEEAIPRLRDEGVSICALSGVGGTSISEFKIKSPVVYVLGNETTGVSKSVSDLCTHQIKIPMSNGVESLNVSVVAALLAFNACF